MAIRRRSASAGSRAARARRAGEPSSAVTAGRDQSLDRERGRLRVRARAGLRQGTRRRGPAGARMYPTARERARAAQSPPVPASASSAAPVSSTSLDPPRGREVEAAVGVLLAHEPRELAAGGATPAARSASTANAVRLVWPDDRAVRARYRAPSAATRLRPPKLVAGSPAAPATRMLRSIEPGSDAEADPALDVVDQAATARDATSLRVLARGGEAERRPARVQRVRGGPSPAAAPKPPSAFWAASRYPAGVPAADARPLRNAPGWPASQASEERRGRSRARRRRARQVTLQAHREAAQRADQRGPEREREREAAGGVDEVEPDPLADVHAELGEAVVAVGDPVADVLQRGEREADDGARRSPAASGRSAGAVTTASPAPIMPVGAPAGHLPGRPRPLAEEEVRGERRRARRRRSPGPPPSA